MLKTELVDVSLLSDMQLQAGYRQMSKERQRDCDRFLCQQDKRLCIAADTVLKRLVGETVKLPPEQVVIHKNENGKPYTDYGVFVSVSHSGDLVLAAVSDKPVGVDIEKIKPVKLGTLRHFCSEADREFLFRHSETQPEMRQDNEFVLKYYYVWTFKEAYFKCYGAPLDFTQVSFCDYDKQVGQTGEYVYCIVEEAGSL